METNLSMTLRCRIDQRRFGYNPTQNSVGNIFHGASVYSSPVFSPDIFLFCTISAVLWPVM